MNHTPQTTTEKLELTAHNLQAEIDAMQAVEKALADFKRKDFKSKWLTNHLKDKGIEAYYYNQSYSERLVIRYVTKEYRQSWNDNNESYYGVFPRTVSIDVYFTDINSVIDLQERLNDWVARRMENLEHVNNSIENVDVIGNIVDSNLSRIKELQGELDGLDYHVRVAFGLAKN